ncbi:MAG: urea carboxylase-associated family protein [Gammaproteobacteria bacterium]|nr:urea carboxylase-associated family protein [Gammaproteobacteria bacterium]MCG3143667.1 hypothetical protein [Gammaproteobacteria bacterium]
MSELVTIPARHGKAARLALGQSIRIVNTHGNQVVDTWAFNAADLQEFMSMEHARAYIDRIRPRVGDPIASNHRRPILTLTEDTSPGAHDTLIAACDIWRYQGLGCREYHRNCTDNLREAMAELGLAPPECPSPLNLWMNIPVVENDGIQWLPPASKPGDYVVLRAEIDCIVAMSACPQDMIPINGFNPVEAHFIVT